MDPLRFGMAVVEKGRQILCPFTADSTFVAAESTGGP